MPKSKRTSLYIVILLACAAMILAVVQFVQLSYGTPAPSASPVAALMPSPSPDPTPSPSPSPTPEPTPDPTPDTVKMSITGDLMCHMWQMDNARQPDGSYDFHYAFQHVKPYLSDADLTVGNLETTFAGADIGHSGYPMFNAPDALGEALRDAGFDLLSTANNHSNDKREAGILRTLEVLDTLGISHVGTYASQEDRDTILIKEINGMTFAFISYSYSTNGIPLAAGKPYLCNLLDDGTALAEDIRRARALDPDFVIVMPHMGDEYALTPRQVYRDWADLMFDAGADIILASHPHVLQPAEFRRHTDENGVTRDCFIIYSLGNFISSQRDVPRDAGLILNLYFKREPGEKATLDRVGFMPTWVKFVNAAGAYDITVYTVHDLLSDTSDLRGKDITRLRNVLSETTKIYLGESVPLEEMQEEYFMTGWTE